MYCKPVRTRRCTACKKVIKIGESFETHSIGKARFYYCFSCAWWGGGLTKRAADGAKWRCKSCGFSSGIEYSICIKCKSPRR